MKSVVKLTQISKSYGSKHVLNDISLEVKKGEIYGLIGRNGAGKTTIMKIMLGLIRANSGSVYIEGDGEASGNRLKVGSIIETPTFLDNRTLCQNLTYQAKLLGMIDFDARIDELLKLVGLEQEKNNKVKNLSLGMRQKLGIATALLNDPTLLVLDEPINGLDPVAIAEVRSILKKINKEHSTTILISSHILGELQKLSTRYGFINGGKLVAELSEEEIESQNIDLESAALKYMGVQVYE